jgi:hypothetical protein
MYENYVSDNLPEVVALLGMMMLASPTFLSKGEIFPDRNIHTVFAALNAGLDQAKDDLGAEKHELLLAMSARMRAHFEADPEDKTDDSLQGRELIDEMIDVLG